MSQISPPIRILLVCAVAFMAAWMLFLRPWTDAGTPAADDARARGDAAGRGRRRRRPSSFAGQGRREGERGDRRAGRARRAARRRRRRDRRDARTGAPSRPRRPRASRRPRAPKPGKLTKKAAAAGGLPLRVLKAIGDRKVVVLLFWSPKAAEDKAVRKALASIDRHDGKVLAHATHVKRIARLRADHARRRRRAVADRRRRRSQPQGRDARRATSTGVTIDQAVTDALRTS